LHEFNGSWINLKLAAILTVVIGIKTLIVSDNKQYQRHRVLSNITLGLQGFRV